MAIPITEVRQGMTIVYEGAVCTAIEYKHVRKAQGAVVRLKFRNLKTGAIFERTFDVNEKMDTAYVERRPAQFLYKDSDSFHFMDQETFDQRGVSPVVIGDAAPYLKDGLEVQLVISEGEVVGIDLPRSVELKVIETPPSFRGDTASGGGKPATLETGLTIQVPFHINAGDILRVDTREKSYIERV